MDIKVRRARPADREAVIPLWAGMMRLHHELDSRFRPAANAESLFREGFARLVNDRHTCVLVAEQDGALAGYIVGTIRVTHELLEPRFVGYVTDISVRPDARRAGIGRALVLELKAWYRERRIDVVLLRAASRNPTSLGFWEAMGWSEHMREMWYEERHDRAGREPDPGEQGG